MAGIPSCSEIPLLRQSAGNEELAGWLAGFVRSFVQWGHPGALMKSTHLLLCWRPGPASDQWLRGFRSAQVNHGNVGRPAFRQRENCIEGRERESYADFSRQSDRL